MTSFTPARRFCVLNKEDKNKVSDEYYIARFHVARCMQIVMLKRLRRFRCRCPTPLRRPNPRRRLLGRCRRSTP
jgi:hypothetical protein